MTLPADPERIHDIADFGAEPMAAVDLGSNSFQVGGTLVFRCPPHSGRSQDQHGFNGSVKPRST